MWMPLPIRRPAFQSTPPARGATILDTHLGSGSSNFNPRPPRGGRHLTDEYERKEEKFQSTPPARGATKERGVYVIGAIFQSTPPARGATPVK